MEKKKLVREITSMSENFVQWYTDVVKKAELCDYSCVRGCMVIRPYGYAIWENIQKYMDNILKATNHENVYMPLFIPESLLEKEKKHIVGFAPEVAWVTHGGSEKLNERLCVRPTSETLFCDHFSKIIQSYNDLPKLYNQWCSAVRWEKTTRPFLRTLEFLWQEGHTVHETIKEAMDETIQMLNIYSDLCENLLAIPVIKGRKTDKEKFAGAEATYAIESLMYDGKALQCCTSHYFGNGFAKTFNIRYTDNTGKLQYAYQTSWGLTSRLIGALIMVHGNDSGLVLPPKIAPIQVMIIPITIRNTNVMEKVEEIKNMISKKTRIKIDVSNKMPGWKFSEYEMKGIPLRLEIGQKDIENNRVVLVRRDTHEKIMVPINEISFKITELLEDIQKNLLEKARTAQEKKTFSIFNLNQMTKLFNLQSGFAKAMWCGEQNCEDKIKELTGASARCIPFDQEIISKTCVCCEKEAKKLVYWGKAY